MGNLSKLRLFLVFMSVALLPLLQGCLGSGPAPNNPPNENGVLLRNAVERMKALRSYHFWALVGTPAQHTEMSGDVDVANNRAMLVITGTVHTSNVIVIGRDAYFSEAGGSYIKAASNNLDLEGVLGIWERFKLEDIDKARDALRDGSPGVQTLDGVSTKVIVGSAVELNALTGTGGETGQEGTVTFWVSTGDTPYVHRMRVDGKTGSAEVAGTFEWSRFNETFDIKAPEGQ